MKLARVIRTGGIWVLAKPYSIVDKPPVGTIVQYELDVNEMYEVYFPGVCGFAWVFDPTFDWYFEPL